MLITRSIFTPPDLVIVVSHEMLPTFARETSNIFMRNAPVKAPLSRGF